jgi:hypothetical protein
MSTATQVRTLSLDLADYLETTYRPDREYVNGELRERNVGKFEHARLQSLFADRIIDPKTRSGRMSVGADWVAAKRLVVAGASVYLELDELFAKLTPSE